VGKKKKEQMKKVNALIFQNFGQAGNAPPLDQ
jgi:hypothetical protein